MRNLIVFTALAGLAALVALTALPASASPAGVNGQISYDRADPSSQGDTNEYTANLDGTHAQKLLSDHACCANWSHGSKLAIGGTAWRSLQASDKPPTTHRQPTAAIVGA